MRRWRRTSFHASAPEVTHTTARFDRCSRRRAIRSSAGGLLLAGAFASAPWRDASAQEPSAPASPADPAPASTLPPGVVSPTGYRGFGFTSPDGQDSLLIHWLVDADFYTFLGGLPPGVANRDTFLLGFAGLELEATLSGIWHSSVLASYAGSRLTLLDAYVEGRFHPAFNVLVGKFEPPINEERITPLFLLPWISIGVANFLTPVRELGAQVYGDLSKGLLSYNLALVNGSYAGTITDNDFDSDKDVMGRVYVHPFAHSRIGPLENVGIGVGGSYGDHNGSSANPETPVLRTYGGATFFSYSAPSPVVVPGAPAVASIVAQGRVARLAPHLTWAYGPVAAFADYVHEVDQFGGTNVQSDAWSATASVALTGEAGSPFARIRVARPWRPSRWQFGGVQLVVGGGQLHVSDAAFFRNLAAAGSMQQANILGGGLNWYPIDGVGVLVDYSYTGFQAPTGQPGRAAENTLYSRVEFHM